MLRGKRTARFTNRESGMTLIEVAIGMIVLGLLVTAIIPFYNIYKIDKIRNTTLANQADVERALKRFALINGRYPGPAKRDLDYGDANYGREVLSGISNCSWDDPDVCRITSNVRQFSARAGAERVIVGDVPFATIGLPYLSMLDGYGNRMTYAVTEHMTSTGGFNQDWGSIYVRNANNVNNSSTDKNTTSSAHYVVVSHGANGVGAYTKSGTLRASCNVATSLIGVDKENCDRDGIFKNNYDITNTYDVVSKRKQVDVVGTDYYDDRIKYVTSLTNETWRLSGSAVATGTTILNNTALRIGGADSTADLVQYHDNNSHSNPRARLTIVTGSSAVPRSIKATELHATRICSAQDNNSNGVIDDDWCSNQNGSSTATNIPNYYFNPAVIGVDGGGTAGSSRAPISYSTRGIVCGSDQAIIDIHRTRQICLATEGSNARVYDNTFKGALTDCPDGPPTLYPRGVDSSGQLICAIP
jgi:type II secretory pathway pseudopilin PulG